ncbi:MAG: hypothetical protein ABSE56_21790 [Bryobacteraceae bacterium]|jgi:hypothetical protein
MADLPDLPPDAQARIKAAETAAAATLRIYQAEGDNSVAEACRGSAGDLDFEPTFARLGWQEARYYYQQGRIDAAERVFDAHAREYLKAVQPDVGRFLAILSHVGKQVLDKYGGEAADAILIRNLVWQKRAWKQHPQAGAGDITGAAS